MTDYITSQSMGRNTPWPILHGVFPVILSGHRIYSYLRFSGFSIESVSAGVGISAGA